LAEWHLSLARLDGLNRRRLAADTRPTVASNLPLVLIPVPALVLGALVAVGLL
jgi:hypothetical protein